MSRTAVILAGGSASANGFASDRPKLLLPIANRPLIDYMAASLRGAGVDRLIISLGSADAADRLLENMRRFPLHAECVVEEMPRGTAGSLKEIESRLRGSPFWVVSGDLFLEADLRRMLTVHRELGSTATVGVCHVHEPAWKMERVEIVEGSRVKAIHRIHPAENRRSILRPAGLYLFEPAVLNFIPERGYFDLKEQLFPRLAEHGAPANVWEIPGYCQTISSLADYLAVNRDVLLGRVRPRHIQRYPRPESSGLGRSQISPTATVLEPVVFGPGSSIGEGAVVIGPTAIGEDCHVEANAVLNECVVFSNTRIGRGARLDRCILGSGSVVDDGAVLRDTIVLERTATSGNLAVIPGQRVSLGPSELTRPSGRFGTARQLQRVGKRAFDLVFATIGLATFVPLMGAIALAIKLDSPGQIIFRQRRSGQHGHEFTMYKFRTMVANADELKRELVARNEVDGPMFKVTGDPRITLAGRGLRATNLDELPQLWNVLRGEMSLVGPRPLSMDEMRFNPQWRDIRLSVRPGLTGLWQVEAHTKVSFADWIRFDHRYVRDWSFWLDLKIMLKTVLNVLKRRGDGNAAYDALPGNGLPIVDPNGDGLNQQPSLSGSRASDMHSPVLSAGRAR